ncbi:MAG TPA: polysaccharide biosynthesis/export family protein [Urbifossiella sp.]|jgi:protein involved in polysaccharide export with SLBB domain|nr:polysaccharide biosynthesis/export family protein [Urbifossiella sp.]
MVRQGFWKRLVAAAALAALAGGGAGCHSMPLGNKCCKPPKFDPCCLPELPVPRELNKVSLPPYVIETPDILIIEATRLIPLPPYRVEPLDVLYVSGRGVFETDPLNGLYPVDPDGTINLGPAYGGQVRVVDMTTDQIQQAVQAKVKAAVPQAQVTVSLAQSRGAQQVAGQHIVRPDGTVGLGSYGSVYVAGMTIAQAKQAVEAHLARYLYRPEVNIDVYAFNSKFYYVITDFAGAGEQVVRLPHVGNETVLDAVANIGGLSAVSSKKLWVARPAPTDSAADQILPVDWCGITQRGQVKTNYQLLPGDRVYILSQPLTKFDTYLARVYAPIQRTMGVAIYGATTYRSFATLGQLNNGTNNNGGVQPFIPILP